MVEKVQGSGDPEIRAKWKAEALELKFAWIEAATMLVPYEDRESYLYDDQRIKVNVALSEKQVEYVLAELDGYAKLRDVYTGAQVSAISSEFIHRSYCCCNASIGSGIQTRSSPPNCVLP